MNEPKQGLGLGWTVTALGAITGSVGVALGFFLKKSIGIALIILAIVFALNSFREDIFNYLHKIQEHNQASEIRQLELEREKLRLEVQEREQQRKHQAAQEIRRERAEQRQGDARVREVIERADEAIRNAEKYK
jgi:hypothetical protein